MRTIYKYRLSITDYQTVAMPEAAKILCAMVQDDQLCLWAEVWSGNETEVRKIHIIGTGNPMPQVKLIHIDSVIMPPFVWHVYEEAK